MSECGRSDCRAAATVQVLARSQSGRTWVGQACEEHWVGTLQMVEDLGFEPLRMVEIGPAGVAR